jgi:hypothetical protein
MPRLFPSAHPCHEPSPLLRATCLERRPLRPNQDPHLIGQHRRPLFPDLPVINGVGPFNHNVCHFQVDLVRRVIPAGPERHRQLVHVRRQQSSDHDGVRGRRLNQLVSWPPASIPSKLARTAASNSEGKMLTLLPTNYVRSCCSENPSAVRSVTNSPSTNLACCSTAPPLIHSIYSRSNC